MTADVVQPRNIGHRFYNAVSNLPQSRIVQSLRLKLNYLKRKVSKGSISVPVADNSVVLPFEVLSVIFEYVMHMPLSEEEDVLRLSFMHVCRFWRSTALCNKCCWTYVSGRFSKDRRDQNKLVSRLRLAAKYGKGSPLNVRFLLISPGYNSKRKKEIKLKYKKLELAFKQSTFPLKTYEEISRGSYTSLMGLFGTLSSKLSMSRLQTLTHLSILGSSHESAKWSMLKLPNLECLRITKLRSETVDVCDFGSHNVRSISLIDIPFYQETDRNTVPLGILSRGLQTFPSLTEVVLFGLDIVGYSIFENDIRHVDSVRSVTLGLDDRHYLDMTLFLRIFRNAEKFEFYGDNLIFTDLEHLDPHEHTRHITLHPFCRSNTTSRDRGRAHHLSLFLLLSENLESLYISTYKPYVAQTVGNSWPITLGEEYRLVSKELRDQHESTLMALLVNELSKLGPRFFSHLVQLRLEYLVLDEYTMHRLDHLVDSDAELDGRASVSASSSLRISTTDCVRQLGEASFSGVNGRSDGIRDVNDVPWDDFFLRTFGEERPESFRLTPLIDPSDATEERLIRRLITDLNTILMGL